MFDRLGKLLDERLANSHRKVAAKRLIQDTISARSTQFPPIVGFEKRFVQLQTEYMKIRAPWGYQSEAFLVMSPHIFTLELLTYHNFMSESDAKLFLRILIRMRSLTFSVEPLLNRTFNEIDVANLQNDTHHLRKDMCELLNKLTFPKNHWLTTLVNGIMRHGVGQCDYLESMHK